MLFLEWRVKFCRNQLFFYWYIIYPLMVCIQFQLTNTSVWIKKYCIVPVRDIQLTVSRYECLSYTYHIPINSQYQLTNTVVGLKNYVWYLWVISSWQYRGWPHSGEDWTGRRRSAALYRQNWWTELPTAACIDECTPDTYTTHNWGLFGKTISD